MSKELSPLKALEHLCETCHKHIQNQPSKGYLPFKECPWRHISNDYCEEYETVKKSLKALEIIKKKEVNIYIFAYADNAETYNDMVASLERQITKDEFVFLKEVLL